MLRVWCTAALVLWASVQCLAQGNARQDQINAAIDRAVAALQRQVYQMPLTDDLTVGVLIEQTGGQEHLEHVLRRAQLVGGPRWISADACQVRLEIAGPVVARAISAVAAAHPVKSPISNDALQKVLATWQDHDFAAEGTNTASAPTTAPRSAPPPPPASQPASLIPLQPPAWVARKLEASGQSAPGDSSLQTMHAAQLDARRHLLTQVDVLPLSNALTLGQAAQRQADIAQALQRGLDHAEITRVHYDEKGAVTLRMTLNLWRLWRELAALPQP